MKILLVSRLLPSLGGLETMARLIGIELTKMEGVELKVITDCAGSWEPDFPAEIMRNPGLVKITKAYKWADVVFFNHSYIQLAAPLLWIRKPYVVSMSGVIPPRGLSLPETLRFQIMRLLLKKATANIAACEAVRLGNEVPAVVITNPFDAKVYNDTVPYWDRPYDFIFAGRILEIKGCFDMIHALRKVKDRTGLAPTLSVAGHGADLEEMKALASRLGIGSQLRMLGVLKGDQLALEMNRHRCILVPSKYEEPIGIVCLEGLACGCVAIGSTGGGLGESVGPCGFTFTNGDVGELTEAMIRVLTLNQQEADSLRNSAPGHLAKYFPAKVVKEYHQILSEAIASR